MGVDVASFGDFFADKRTTKKAIAKSKAADAKEAPSSSKPQANGEAIMKISAEEKPTEAALVKQKPVKDQEIKCLVYKDPFGSTYKKYIFTADGKYLLGGMMIGDVGDYVKLVSIVKKKVLEAFHELLAALKACSTESTRCGTIAVHNRCKERRS